MVSVKKSKPCSDSKSTFFVFLIPSLMGLFLFMTPVSYKGELTVPIALMASALQALLAPWIQTIVTGVIVFSAVMTVLATCIQPALLHRFIFWQKLFKVTLLWLCVRVVGAVFAVMVHLHWGPQVIWGNETGGMMLRDLLPVLFSVFIFAGLLLPLLLSFGLLELMGALLTKVMRPVFLLPGRSAIDCIASLLGDGSVGVLLTSKQYECGYYTKREAAVIGTSFSTVSITFSLVVIAQVGLQHLFVPFFITVITATLVAALIMPKLPPLCWKKDTYIDGSARQHDELAIPEGTTVFKWGLQQALQAVRKTDSSLHIVKDGCKNAIDMVFGVLPIVMAIGTMALIMAVYTPVFEYMGKPFLPLLELLRIPQAAEASTTLVVGFADMFVPSILAASLESDMTRFVIAALSLTQLIYLSEVGALLLGSKIPIAFMDLFFIFILRTLITLPVIAGIAHIIF